MDSKIYSLPIDMKEKVLKLAREHGITIDEAYNYYLMGGENADYLCYLKDAGCSESFIELHNQIYWEEKNKKILKELKSQ
jgi:DNA-binding transcriptional MocR family regulator